VVEGTGLENQRGATYRGFESHPLRQIERKTAIGRLFFLYVGISSTSAGSDGTEHEVDDSVCQECDQ
jgi:hypothetical protein